MENLDNRDFVPTVVIEQQDNKKQKKRGLMTTGVSLALAATLGLGGTFAWFHYTTNMFENKFTTDKEMNITADTLEPAWAAGVANTTTRKQDQAGGYIPAGAYAMKPNSSVSKDPFVVNTSKNGSHVFAGLKLQFKKWDPTARQTPTAATTGGWVNMTRDEVDKLLNVYSFSSITNPTAAGFSPGTSWTQIVGGTGFAATAGHANDQGAMHFYCSTRLAALTAAQATAERAGTTPLTAGQAYSTSNLFTNVKFMPNATEQQVNDLRDMLTFAAGDTFANQPGWSVEVTGGAIDAEGFSGGASDFVDGHEGVTWASVLNGAPATTDKSGVRAATA